MRALHEPGPLQVDEEPVDGGLVELQQVGELGHPELGASAVNAPRIAAARSIAWMR